MLTQENVRSSRRRLTLGLGRAVMTYNDRAAPGLGGLWFIRQAALALLGLYLAERYPAAGSKIQVANAIEALACLVGYEERKWARREWRLRGPRKLRQFEGADALRFKDFLGSGAYVSQPMRMGSVDALPGLGLVDVTGTLFNSFSVNARGLRLIEAAFPKHKALLRTLDQWVRGHAITIGDVRRHLNPSAAPADAARQEMGDAIKAARENEGKNERLINAVAWMRQVNRGRHHKDWDTAPKHIGEDHWKDMRAGAFITRTRNAAIGLVAEIEQHLVDHDRLDLTRPLDEGIAEALEQWRISARNFKALDLYNPGEAAKDVLQFCDDALLGSEEQAIGRLVKRESHMLDLNGQMVVPTSSWRKDAPLVVQPVTTVGQDPDEIDGSAPHMGERAVFPGDISVRMIFLRRLTLDLDGHLDTFIEQEGQFP